MKKGGGTAVKLRPELYQALESLATERSQTLPILVNQAISEWLEGQEEEEDLQAMAEAEAEGGAPVPWERVKAALSARSDAGR